MIIYKLIEMQWINLYSPTCLDDSYFYKDEIKECIKWFEDYKSNLSNTKKVLMIIGHTGSGKTKLAQLLLAHFKYQMIEYNSSDVRSQKKITEIIKKTLAYRNVIDMFYENKQPVGILMDEIDTICKTGDKGGFSEFLNIIKMNDKYEEFIKEKDKKKKTLKTGNSEEFIKLYNPIICTTNDITDKKIAELKRYSKVIYLNKDVGNEMKNFIIDIFKKNNTTIEEEAVNEIIKISGNDIRRLLIYLENIYFSFKTNYPDSNNITTDFIILFNQVGSEKNEDLQLIDATRNIFYKENSFYNNEILFDVDCLLLPLMIYHNTIIAVKKSKDDAKKKLGIYKEMLYSLCIHDTIQTSIFEIQEWNEYYDVSVFYGAVLPNYYATRLSDYRENQAELQFTNLLNKISQMFVNKKLLSSAKYNMNKLNLDFDEIIYIVEIIAKFLNDFKNDDDDEDEDNEKGENPKSVKKSNSKTIAKKQTLQHETPIIAKMMNKYKINIDELETILKIEKLNQQNDVKKKKFTITLKKEMQKFLEDNSSENII